MRFPVPLLAPVISIVLVNIMFVQGSVRRLEVVKGLNDNIGEHLAVYTVLMRIVRFIYPQSLGIGS